MPTVAADLVALVRAEGVAETQAQLESVGATAEGVGAKSMLGSAGLLGLGAAGLFAADSAFKASENFDTWMRDLASLDPTIAGNTAAYHQMAAAIEQVALNNAQMATDVVKGMYFVASAGYTGKDALEIVNAAARDANAGLTDMASSTKLVTAVLQAYGLGADQAGMVSDKLFAIVRGGVLRYSDLTAQMGDNLSMASSLKVSIDDLGVAYDVLTRHGVSAAETSTQINALMSALLKPSTEMKNVIHDLGFESGQTMIQQLGLIGTLQTLFNSTDGNNTELAAMFKNIRGLRGELALMTGDTKGVAEAQKNMRDSTGATNEALAQQTQATSYHLREMKSAINEVSIALGDGLRPLVSSVADGITRFATGLLALPAPLLHVAGLLLGVGGALLTIVGGGALLEALFGGALGTALESTAVAFGELLIPVAAVAGAVYLLYDAFNHNFLGIRDDITNAFNAISAAVETGTSSFQFFTELGFNPVSAGLAGLSAALTSLGAGGIATFVNQAAFAFQTAWDGATKLWDGLGKVFDGGVRFSSILKQLPDWMRPVALGLIDLTSGIGKLVNGFTDGGLQGAMAAWPDAWRQISHGIEFATQAIAGWLQAAATAASGTIARLADWTLDVAMPKVTGWLVILGDDAWTALKAAVGYTGHLLADAGAWTLNVAMPAITGWLSIFGHDAWEALKATVGYTGHILADAGSWTLNVAMPSVTGWLSILGNDAWTALKAAARFTSDFGATIDTWTLHVAAPTIGSDFGPAITSAIVHAIEGLSSLGSDAANAVWAKIGGFTGWTSLITGGSYDIGGRVGAALHDAILTGVRAIASANWGDILSAVAEAMKVAALAAPAIMLSVATALVSGFTGFIVGLVGGGQAVSDFRQFAANVLSAIANQFRQIQWADIGNAIVDGLKAGIDAVWNNLAANIKGWIEEFIGWFKSALGIASPSTVFAGIGTDIIDGLKNGLSAAWSGIEGWVSGKVQWLEDQFKGLLGFFGIGGGGSSSGQFAGGGGSGGAAGGGGGGFGGGDQGQGQGQSGGIMGLLRGAMGGDTGGAASQFGQLGTDIGNAFNTALYAGLRKAQDSAAAVWSQMKQDAQGLLTAMQTFATTTGSTFNTLLYPGLAAAQATAQAVWNAILASTQSWLSGMQAFATTAGSTFNSLLSAGMGAAVGSAQAFLNAISNAVGSFIGNVAAFATAAGNLFNSGLSQGLGAAVASTRYFMSAIQGAMNIGSQWSLGDSIGNSLGQGINDGIAAWTSTIAGTAANAVTSAVNAAKSAGGIASPSREMWIVGDALGLGAHLGLSAWIGPMGQAGAALTGSAVTGARSSAATGGYGAGNGGVHIHGNVTVQVNGAQPNSGVVNDIFTALGMARTQQVGLIGANG